MFFNEENCFSNEELKKDEVEEDHNSEPYVEFEGKDSVESDIEDEIIKKIKLDNLEKN